MCGEVAPEQVHGVCYGPTRKSRSGFSHPDYSTRAGKDDSRTGLSYNKVLQRSLVIDHLNLHVWSEGRTITEVVRAWSVYSTDGSRDNHAARLQTRRYVLSAKATADWVGNSKREKEDVAERPVSKYEGCARRVRNLRCKYYILLNLQKQCLSL